jgi:hypothetical protein
VTRLDLLDGPATTAVSDRLVDVYRATHNLRPARSPGRPAAPGGLEPDPPLPGPPVGEATSPEE